MCRISQVARFYLYIGFLPRSWPLFFQLFAQGGGEQNEIVWIIGAGRGGKQIFVYKHVAN